MDLIHAILEVLAETQLRHIYFASLDIRLVTQREIVEVIDIGCSINVHDDFCRTDVVRCLRLQATARRITRSGLVKIDDLLFIFLTWRDRRRQNMGLLLRQFHCLPLFRKKWLLKYLLSIGIDLMMHFENDCSCYCDY